MGGIGGEFGVSGGKDREIKKCLDNLRDLDRIGRGREVRAGKGPDCEFDGL